MTFAAMPVVIVAAVGVAMANPFHHHHGNGGAAAACTSTTTTTTTSNTGTGTGTGTGAGPGTGANNGTGANGAAYHNGSGYRYGYGGYGHHHPSGPATTSAPAAPTTSAAAGAGAGMGTGTTTTAPAGGTTTTTAPAGTGAGTGTTTTAPAGTTTTTGAAATTTTAAACPTTPAATTSSAAAAATPNPNCTLIVPANPLTAQGLATPYQFVATNAAMGACHEANVNQSAFVQAAIIDPATGAVSIYDPLVVDMGTQPAAAPVVPTLPANAVVGIWFGFNATNLTLQDSNGSLAVGMCVNGLGNGDVFGQFAYCNAPAFFTAANAAIQGGMLKVPPLGTATDGQPCLTTRDFALIDQDQSDNVPSAYLANGNGQTAQFNAANQAAIGNAVTISNPSDNGLLDNFVDPALGCTPWTVPDLTNNGNPAAALPLDELQAAANQAAPVALVPSNDPMALSNGNTSTQKTNLYRAGVDQPALPAGQTPAVYCGDMDSIQAVRLQQDVNLLMNGKTPSAAAATNLFTFLGMRLQQSFGNLNCQNFGLTNPVTTLGMDGNGVVVSVVFAQATNAVTAGAGNPAEKCVTMANAAAQTNCAMAAAGVPTGAATATMAPSPTPSSTKTPRPKGDMRPHSGHHW